MSDFRRLRLVLFRLGELTCGAPASAVREVIPASRATRIPGADATVAGLVNLRGGLLTVVDGRRVLGGLDPDVAPESVMVLEQDGKVVGVAVDEVLDLIEIDAETLASGADLPGVDPALVQSVGRHEGRVFAILDTRALVAPVLG
jgi:purine-binding chemotaxis protein CheW